MGPRPGFNPGSWLQTRPQIRHVTLNSIGRLRLAYVIMIQLAVLCMCGRMHYCSLAYISLRGLRNKGLTCNFALMSIPCAVFQLGVSPLKPSLSISLMLTNVVDCKNGYKFFSWLHPCSPHIDSVICFDQRDIANEIQAEAWKVFAHWGLPSLEKPWPLLRERTQASVLWTARWEIHGAVNFATPAES